MLDIAYILGTILFFGLMFAYTRACERLGARSTDEEETL